MPRIPPLPESEWDGETRRFLELPGGSLSGQIGDNNVFSTVARHDDLFRAWFRFGGVLLTRGLLPARERELLILRAGYNCRSAYEWGQHARIGEQVGLSREEVLRVAAGPEAEGWSDADRTLLRAADELHEASKISDATWHRLAERYDQRELIELTMLIGHYHMLAFALNSFEVELDDWLEEGLP
jgi:4-carboxymuconolactone decarboxylase